MSWLDWPSLRPDEEFARYENYYTAERLEENGVKMAESIACKHCAGYARKSEVNGRAFLKALESEPDVETAGMIEWVLGSLFPHQCVTLVVCCGASPRSLARHMRTRPNRGGPFARFLNQFTLPDGWVPGERQEKKSRFAKTARLNKA